MQKMILILFLMISNTSFGANKNSGDLIKADDFNSSVFNIGDIKQSILTESQFQSINGDCWVSMSGQSIAGSDLAQLTSMTTLPNAAGRFLRNAGGNSAALGATQEDDFKSHTHIQDAHHHITSGTNINLAVFGRGGSSFTGGTYNNTRADTGHFTSSVTGTNQNTGGLETRPQNLTVNMFIKINKQCNFN